MYKKMRFYVPLLIILWSSALADGLIEERKEYKELFVVKAIQDNNENNGIFYEREAVGRMEVLEMELEARKLLTAYKGEMVKTLYGENFYCFYGYSDRIRNYVVSDGEKINLNLVITYDEENDVTHIVWATPFLNEDF